MALYRSPLTVTLWPSSFLQKYGPMIPPAQKAHQTVSFSGCNGVSTYTCGIVHSKCGSFFVDVAIQPEVSFIAKENLLMKIRNNGNLVLGPLDESTPCLMIVLTNCQTKLRLNHLTAVKSVAILESKSNLNFYS
ncbi:alpha-2 adrenergic receptor [Trichonephila clavipes]|nr:alpha-2 adrenergic receptor [Trichonephila clavipes]